MNTQPQTELNSSPLSYYDHPILRLSHKQDQAWEYLNDDVTTELLYGGGAGGGKSYLGCVWHIYRRTLYPHTRGLIGRAKISNLEQSTLVTLLKVAQLMGYQQGVHFNYNSQKHVINWANGSQTILKDLFLYPSDPDFISLGSTEYTDAFIDEANELTEKAVDIIKTRIRWMLHDYNLVPKILMTANPSPGWLKERYVIDRDGRAVELQPYQKFVRALVTDNPDQQFVDLYKGQLERMHSDYDKQRLLFGDWEAESESINPFAFNYDPAIHEVDEPFEQFYNPHKALYISIDFNLNPFAVTFWQHWQDKDGFHFHGVDEAEIQQGSIPDMIDLIKRKYWQVLHTCIVTGDAMGKQANIAHRDNASHYISIQRGLNLSNHQIQVPPNPTHINSRDDVNFLFYLTKLEGSKFHVKLNKRTMPNTCRDFKYVQCDATGGIIKGKRTDLNQRADYLDTGRYFINLTAKQLILRYRKPHEIPYRELKNLI